MHISILNYKSCHVPHIKREIPYRQDLRLEHICSDKNILEKQLQELKGYLVRRGYDWYFVESQFKRVKRISRSSLFTCKESSEITTNRNYFVVDYYLVLCALYGIFRELQQVR